MYNVQYAVCVRNDYNVHLHTCTSTCKPISLWQCVDCLSVFSLFIEHVQLLVIVTAPALVESRNLFSSIPYPLGWYLCPRLRTTLRAHQGPAKWADRHPLSAIIVSGKCNNFFKIMFSFSVLWSRW